MDEFKEECHTKIRLTIKITCVKVLFCCDYSLQHLCCEEWRPETRERRSIFANPKNSKSNSANADATDSESESDSDSEFKSTPAEETEALGRGRRRRSGSRFSAIFASGSTFSSVLRPTRSDQQNKDRIKTEEQGNERQKTAYRRQNTEDGKN
ncbi:uncharacterized protein LOC128264486 [Drosophila gunungcola]|uniref:uncharacterized protein LOC128264486 n=1 Tax=Drosophila gunungcola TaxID=103775 RepID=UPI0022E173EB|nr:uncharacterized protein LOC128264486 [Drosophila gunungcola]